MSLDYILTSCVNFVNRHDRVCLWNWWHPAGCYCFCTIFSFKLIKQLCCRCSHHDLILVWNSLVSCLETLSDQLFMHIVPYSTHRSIRNELLFLFPPIFLFICVSCAIELLLLGVSIDQIVGNWRYIGIVNKLDRYRQANSRLRHFN
jgi:hypothetical protein